MHVSVAVLCVVVVVVSDLRIEFECYALLRLSALSCSCVWVCCVLVCIMVVDCV